MKPTVTALSLVFLLLTTEPAFAQRNLLGRELLDAARRFLGREAAESGVREGLEEGTEALAARVAERLTREGGEGLVARAVRLTDELGPRTLRILDDSPVARELVDVLDTLPAPERRMAVSAFTREGATLHEAFAKLGAPALRAELRHPGVGGGLAAALGDDGARLLDDVDTLDVTVLARHQDEIAALPTEARGQLFDAIGRNAKGVADYLRAHPGFALTAATVGILVVESDRAAEGIASALETGAEALGDVATTGASHVFRWVAPVLAGALALWFGLRLRRSRKRA